MSEVMDMETKREGRAIAPVSNGAPAVSTPMEMLAVAVSNGASVETLEKLMTLQERYEANRARKAFIEAMTLARAKFKPILKKNDGYASRYKFETLTDVMDAVDPALNEHGFSYDWITEDIEGGNIRVTCVLTHEDGHSRKNSLSGNPKDTADAKANMNGFQRMGGAVTYLQRYTLKSALGIAASKDTDGRGEEAEEGFDTTPWTEKIIAAGKSKNALLQIQTDLKAIRKDIPNGAWTVLSNAWSGAMKAATDE